jgi:natural product precursor
MKQKPTNKKFSLKKLSLQKETIAVLDSDKMNDVRGGTLTPTVTSFFVNCEFTR